MTTPGSTVARRFANVEGDYLLEPVHANDDDVVGERSAGQTRAGTARHEWQSFGGQQSNDGDRLVTVSGEDSQPRLTSVSGKPIGVVDQQLARTAEDVPLAHDFGQTLCDTVDALDWLGRVIPEI